MPGFCVPTAYPERLLPQTMPGHELVGHPHTPSQPAQAGQGQGT